MRFGVASIEYVNPRDGLGTLEIIAITPPRPGSKENRSVIVLIPVREDEESVFIPRITINGMFFLDMLEMELQRASTD